MVSVFGNDITSAFTGGESVDAIYCEGVKVWPDTAPGEYYVKWWPKSASGSFIMGGEARWLQDYNGYYSGPFLLSRYTNTISLYYMDSSAFAGNSEIYAIETNLPAIGTYAFKSCTSLSYVSASECITLFGQYNNTFAYCTSLLKVYLPVCSHVGFYTFRYCSNLRDITLTSATVLGEQAFINCIHLPDIYLPNCRNIDEQVFMNCYDLETVILPVCSWLHDSVFVHCSNLNTVVLGYSGVCSLGFGVFNSTPMHGGSGSIFVPLEWVSEYKESYPGLSSHIFPIPHN